MHETPYISVVIPVRNEQDNVVELRSSLEQALVSSYEIIFIDDGSNDLTWEKLKEMHDPGCVRLVRFGRPCGKTAALVAGFRLTRGSVVFTLDGDLQDDPSEIPRFLDKLSEGVDMVCGWKKKRNDPLGKVIMSRIFNFVVARVTTLKLHDINCGYKLFRGDVVRSLQFYGEMHRFLPVLVASQGYRVTEIEVTHHARRYGQSKYGAERLLKGFVDLGTVLLQTHFLERPAHGFGLVAVILAVLGVVTGIGYTLLPSLGWVVVSIISWMSAVVFMAAGWVAEVLLAARPYSACLPITPVVEQLD